MEFISMDYYKRWLVLALVTILIIGYQISHTMPGGASVIQMSDADPLTMAVIQNNSLVAMSPPGIIASQVLASLSFSESENIEELLNEIERRESGHNPKACNIQFGCKAGMGSVGFIASTWNETIDRMMCRNKFETKNCLKAYLPERCDEKIVFPISGDKHEAVFDRECNLTVARWLLIHDGIRHWQTWSGPYNIY